MKTPKLAARPIILAIGEILTYRQQSVEICKLAGRRFQLKSLTSHEIFDVELFDLLVNSQLRDEIQPDSDDDDTDLFGEAPFAEHGSLLPWQRQELTRRIEVLQWILVQEADGAPIRATVADAAAEMGCSVRTVNSWLKRFRDGYDPVDKRWCGEVSARIDSRWIALVREGIAALYNKPRRTRDVFLEEIEEKYLAAYGDDPTHQVPSPATAYRWLERLGFKKSIFEGSTETMRSIADRATGPGGKLIACYPGEYVMMDTHTLDLWGLDPLTNRAITLQITTVIDLFSRDICALRITAESTKSVDMASVLFEMIYGQECPDDIPDTMRFNYHGIPKNIVFTEDSSMWGMPCVIPATLITDHGRALLNAQTLAVCRAFGIRIQPAQAYKPTDKAVMERFYRTLEHDLIQRLAGYKGNKVEHKGRNPEHDAVYYPIEIDNLIRQYICGTYHQTHHSGLVDPHQPGARHSPKSLYEAGIRAAGFLRVPRCPEDALLFLQTEFRYIHHYGVEIGGLIYNVPQRHPAFTELRDVRSSAKGKYPGRYCFRVNPSDLRYIYFQRPDDGSWHTIPWEYANAADMPFSRDISIEARTLTVSHDTRARKEAIRVLLRNFDKGLTENRRQRRLATQRVTAAPSWAEPNAVPSSLIDAVDVRARKHVQATDLEFLTDDLDDTEPPHQVPLPTEQAGLDSDDYYTDAIEESL